MYGAAGQVTGGPYLYTNAVGQVSMRPPFVFQELRSGNFSPRGATWSAQLEQQIAPFLKLRAGYMKNQSVGLVVMNRSIPDPVTHSGEDLLTPNGQSRYRQFEITAKVRLKLDGQLFLSYVRSKSSGDLNDFAGYLGSFPAAMIRGNQYSTLPTDLPNRFLAWGLIRLPLGIRIGPSIEYRSGFPFSKLDAMQNYVGIPNQFRFPNFFSVDSRVSKDFKINSKYTVRLSVSSYNLTNHFNPEAIHANVGDPASGMFFGHRGRRFTADFDFIF